MALGKEDLKKVAEFLGMIDEIETLAEEVKPLAERAVGLLCSHVGPLLRQLSLPFALGITSIKIEQIKLLEGAGFSREDAIVLVQDEWYALSANARARQGKGK